MSEIYLGRIVAIGRNQAGRLAALYRVSSRSFPNRRAVVKETAASIVPKEGSEGDVFENPYIAYNCARLVGDVAVLTNGAQTDPIAERIEAGMPIRDAMALSLLALDYEHDQLDTPRIAAAVRAGGESGFLGVVRRDGLNVHELALTPGTCWHVSTYEHNDILPDQEAAFDADSAPACCRFILQEGVFAGFLNPISAVCAYEGENGFELAAQDV